MEDLRGNCCPGLSVKILRCDSVPVLSFAGDLQELMFRLKIFCVAVGDGTAVLLSGVLSLDRRYFSTALAARSAGVSLW